METVADLFFLNELASNQDEFNSELEVFMRLLSEPKYTWDESTGGIRWNPDDAIVVMSKAVKRMAVADHQPRFLERPHPWSPLLQIPLNVNEAWHKKLSVLTAKLLRFDASGSETFVKVREALVRIEERLSVIAKFRWAAATSA